MNNKRENRGMVFFLLGLCLVNSVALAQNTGKLYRQAKQDANYVETSAAEAVAAESLFRRTLGGDWDLALAASWQEAGFEWTSTEDNGKQFAILSETENHRSGRGFFVFAKNPSTSHVLQIPHGFRDLGTDKIALSAIPHSVFSAVALNTVPRNFTEDDNGASADLSDAPTSWFTALARAAIKRDPNSLVIQFHGFAQNKRVSEAGESADLIVSPGHKKGSFAANWITACARNELPFNTLSYPSDVNELGALSNSVVQSLKHLDRNAFVHLEMSRPLRKTLRRDPLMLNQLLGCIEGASR